MNNTKKNQTDILQNILMREVFLVPKHGNNRKIRKKVFDIVVNEGVENQVVDKMK